MPLPLLGNEFFTSPTPQGSISSTTANLMALGGQALAKRIETDSQVSEARALGPQIANIYAAGYNKVANGDFTGFHEIQSASMMGVGNPFLMEASKEATQVGVSVANNWLQQQMEQKRLNASSALETQRETGAMDRLKYSVDNKSANGSTTAADSLQFHKQQAAVKMVQQIRARQDFNSKKQAIGMPPDTSPITTEDGQSVPYDATESDVLRILGVNQQQGTQLSAQGSQATQGQQVSSIQGSPQGTPGDTSLNPPLPSGDSAPTGNTLPLMAGSGSPPVQQVQQTDTRATQPQNYKGDNPAQSDSEFITGSKQPNLVNESQSAQPKQPGVAVVNTGKGDVVQMSVARRTFDSTGKETIELEPDRVQQALKEQYGKQVAEDSLKLTDSLTAFQRNQEAAKWVLDKTGQKMAVQTDDVPKDKATDVDPGGKLFVSVPKDAQHPNGREYYQDAQGETKLQPEFYNAFKDVQKYTARLASAGVPVSFPHSEVQQVANNQPAQAAQQPSSSILSPEQVSASSQKYQQFADVLGQNRVDEILSMKVPDDQKQKLLVNEGNAIHKIAVSGGALDEDTLKAQRQASNLDNAIARTNRTNYDSQNAKATIKEFQSQIDELTTQLKNLSYTGSDKGVADTYRLQAYEKARQIKELSDKIDGLKKRIL